MSASKVFISYWHDDADWARDLAKALLEQGLDVWLDVWQVRAGDSLCEALEAGLRGSDTMVTILSAVNVRCPAGGRSGFQECSGLIPVSRAAHWPPGGARGR